MRQKTTTSILVIASNPVFAAVLSSELESLGYSPTYLGSRCPAPTELAGVLRTYSPALVMVELQATGHWAEVAKSVAAVDPGVKVVATGRNCDPEVIEEVLNGGVAEFLSWPLNEECVRNCVSRTRVAAPAPEQPSDLYAFLPAKAGCGATTLAFNLAFALGQRLKPVLLADFDFTGGSTRLMLNTSGGPSAVKALQTSAALHPPGWRDLVAHYGDVDLLHSGPFDPVARVKRGDMECLLGFARRHYRAVCADLSGNFEPHSLELMDRVRTIFLVCTPERSSLLLAREKMAWLKDHGHTTPVRLLLNRHCRKSLTVAQVQELVGVPVDFTFPNDFNSVARSAAQGAPVAPSSDLGRQCQQFAEKLAREAMSAPSSEAAPESPRLVAAS